MVRSLYENNSLGLGIHMTIFALQNNYDPIVYNRFLSLMFSKLYDYDRKQERFSVANCEASPETNLKELQDFLFELNSKDIDVLALYFLNKVGEDSSVDYAFAQMMYQVQVMRQDRDIAYTRFKKNFPDNKYNYLLKTK